MPFLATPKRHICNTYLRLHVTSRHAVRQSRRTQGTHSHNLDKAHTRLHDVTTILQTDVHIQYRHHVKQHGYRATFATTNTDGNSRATRLPHPTAASLRNPNPGQGKGTHSYILHHTARLHGVTTASQQSLTHTSPYNMAAERHSTFPITTGLTFASTNTDGNSRSHTTKYEQHPTRTFSARLATVGTGRHCITTYAAPLLQQGKGKHTYNLHTTRQHGGHASPYTTNQSLYNTNAITHLQVQPITHARQA
jgi:hypothetical protein